MNQRDENLIGLGSEYDQYIGVWPGVLHNDYLEWPGVSSSFLACFRPGNRLTPAAIRYGTTETTDAMRLGTVVHSLLLEPFDLESQYVIIPKGLRCDSQDYLSLEIDNPGKALIRQSVFEQAISIVEGCSQWPVTDYVNHIPAEDKELSIVWRDSDTGVLCKARLDILNVRDCAIDDIKTVQKAFPPTCIQDDIRRYGYHLRLAHYWNGAAAMLDEPIDKIRILAIEKTPPYQVTLNVICPDDMNAGFQFCAETLELIKGYCKNGWPGPPQDEIYLDPVSL